MRRQIRSFTAKHCVKKSTNARRRFIKAFRAVDRSKITHHPHPGAIENREVGKVKMTGPSDIRFPAMRRILAGIKHLLFHGDLLLMEPPN